MRQVAVVSARADMEIIAGLDSSNPESVMQFKEDYPIYAAIEPILREFTAEEFIRLVSTLDKDKRLTVQLTETIQNRKDARARRRALRKKEHPVKKVKVPPFFPMASVPQTEAQLTTRALSFRRSPHECCLVPDPKCGYRILNLTKPNRTRQTDPCGRRILKI
ncbi:MAG: hypothetical protein V1845_02195 [bacterium]